MSFQGNAFQQNAFQVGGPSNPKPVGVQLCGDPVRPKKQSGFTDLAVNLLLTTLAVAAVNVPRDPLYTQQNKKAPAQVIQTVNLLETTLAPVVAGTPFKPSDFPNPSVRKTTQPSSVTNTLPLLTAEPTVKPFFQSDWQNPTLKRQVQQPYVLNTTQLLDLPSVEVPRQPLYTPRFTRYNPAAYHYTLDYFVGLMPVTPIPPVVDSGIPRYIPNPYIVDLPTGKKRTKAERDELRDEFNGVPKKAVKIIKKVALAVIEQTEPNNDDIIAAFERARVSYEAIYAILLQQEIAKQLEIQRKRREDDEFFLLL